METIKVKIGDITPNKTNPRFIKDEKFKKLVQSIKEFPQMLEIRPIVVDENNVILGGNMRFAAANKAGFKEVFITKAENLTEEQKKEFIVKDNVGFGEWDWDMLANEWETEKLSEWGLEMPFFNDDDDEIDDITELNEINEKCQFIIECSNISDLNIVQEKMNAAGKKINFDKFLDWHEKNCIN